MVDGRLGYTEISCAGSFQPVGCYPELSQRWKTDDIALICVEEICPQGPIRHQHSVKGVACGFTAQMLCISLDT